MGISRSRVVWCLCAAIATRVFGTASAAGRGVATACRPDVVASIYDEPLVPFVRNVRSGCPACRIFVYVSEHPPNVHMHRHRRPRGLKAYRHDASSLSGVVLVPLRIPFPTEAGGELRSPAGDAGAEIADAAHPRFPRVHPARDRQLRAAGVLDRLHAHTRGGAAQRRTCRAHTSRVRVGAGQLLEPQPAVSLAMR